MKMSDIDIHDLPLWLNGICEEIEKNVVIELQKESPIYVGILERSSELLDQYRFISTLIDGDTIKEPMPLSISEARAFSEFLALEADRRDMETVQIYLFGCRHMLQLLQILKLT